MFLLNLIDADFLQKIQKFTIQNVSIKLSLENLIQTKEKIYNTLCLFLSIAINTTLPLVACVLRVYYTGDF